MSALKVFISAAQTELRNERVQCRDVLRQHGLLPVLFEDEPASPESPEVWWRARVAEADVYVGIFWKTFSPPTAQEYQDALALQKPAFVFVKQFDAALRDQRLTELLADVSRTHKYQPFNDVGELGAAVWASVLEWMVAEARPRAAVALPSAIRSALASEVKSSVPELSQSRTSESLRPTDARLSQAGVDVIVGSTSSPSVFIGGVDQRTAAITIAELRPGGLGGSAEGSVIRLRLVDLFDPERRSDDRFTQPPWLVVTSGDLKLAVGRGEGSADTLSGMLSKARICPDDGTCVEWVIYSQSTVASTVEVRGGDGKAPLPSGATNGPAIEVSRDNRPGPMVMSAHVIDPHESQVYDLGLVPVAQRVWTAGTSDPKVAEAPNTDPLHAALIDIAGRVPVLAALSAPLLVRGGVGQRGGDVSLSETAPDQLVQMCALLGHEGAVFAEVLLELDPTIEPGVRFDTRFEPTVSTNAASSGCLAAFAGFEGERTLRLAVWPSALTQTRQVLTIGSVNVSDVHYAVPHDAPTGDVRLAARLRGAEIVHSPAKTNLLRIVTAPFAPDARPSPQVVVNARVM